MRISEILKCTKGLLISGDPNAEIDIGKLSTDSRSTREGGLFIAIKGKIFDGNNFIGDAFKKGAAGAVVSSWHPGHTRTRHPALCRVPGCQGVPIIKVKNTTKAYGEIAGCHRARFNIPVVAVTGSNGKTTTKDMIAHILSGRLNVLKTEGTRNNHIGVPETLIRLKKGVDAAVIEMGMNHAGEIRYLCGIARPSAGVVTNIGESHLKFLGRVENIYKAKMELLDSLPDGAAAILNGDDRFLSGFRTKRLKIITFGLDGHNVFRASSVKCKNGLCSFSLNGKRRFELRLLGRHNIYNALAAAAVSSYLGIGLGHAARRLAEFKGSSGQRLGTKKISGIEFINDSYNSNPLSMRCAIDSLSGYATGGKKFLISGDMLELGRLARSFHAEAGEFAAKAGIDFIFTIGALSRHTLRAALSSGMNRTSAFVCKNHADAALALRRLAKRGDVVLVKGSRAMRMEKVIETFKAMAD